MWETIFILGRETGSKASDHFNDLYITVMLAVIPFVLILLGVVEIIRLLDFKGKKNYQFGMRSIAIRFHDSWYYCSALYHWFFQ